jgi:hypothetical protein
VRCKKKRGKKRKVLLVPFVVFGDWKEYPGEDTFHHDSTVAGHKVRLNVTDAQRKHFSDSIFERWLVDCDGLILIYDLGSVASFDHLVEELELWKKRNTSAPVILVCNHAPEDQYDAELVKKGQNLAFDWSLCGFFISTSKKLHYRNESVVFSEIAKLIVAPSPTFSRCFSENPLTEKIRKIIYLLFCAHQAKCDPLLSQIPQPILLKILKEVYFSRGADAVLWTAKVEESGEEKKCVIF